MTTDSEPPSASIFADSDVVEKSRNDDRTLYARDSSSCPVTNEDRDQTLEGHEPVEPNRREDVVSSISEKFSTNSEGTIYVSLSTSHDFFYIIFQKKINMAVAGRIRGRRQTQPCQLQPAYKMDNHHHGLHFHHLRMYVKSKPLFIIHPPSAHVGMSASTSSAYNMGFASMKPELNCTGFQATIGLSVYALGFGIVPLVTASFSEEFGRQPLYVGSAIGFILMYMMVALYVPITNAFKCVSSKL
jgi:hypothetical protein